MDLKVTADVDGFSHVLVVKSRQAAAKLGKLRFSLGSEGLKVREGNGGGLQAVDEAGAEVFAAPTPLMWDSPGSSAAARAVEPGRGVPPGSRHEAMGLEVSGETLELTPDQAMLSDPATRYPVYLDPSVSAPRGAWAAVWQRYPNTNYLNAADVARVGHESQTGHTNRSFFQLNNGNAIHGKQIIRATFRIYEDWSWSCSPRPVELWLTSMIGNTTTWNNQPAWVTWLDTEHVAKGWGAGCPPGGVEFDATHAAARAAAENWPHITLGLRAADERDTYAWKKFNSNPVLVIEYNSPPATPAAADVWSDPGGACTTVAGTATPGCTRGCTTATTRCAAASSGTTATPGWASSSPPRPARATRSTPPSRRGRTRTDPRSGGACAPRTGSPPAAGARGASSASTPPPRNASPR
ncbi:DNRLRE domain-containing protein [Nonomuraea rubra]|uniref:DNRLRE domain-containing protein n=1 Tax=Nonomuraea rubra TaxID=46180 RepID=UPI00360C5E5F